MQFKMRTRSKVIVGILVIFIAAAWVVIFMIEVPYPPYTHGERRLKDIISILEGVKQDLDKRKKNLSHFLGVPGDPRRCLAALSKSADMLLQEIDSLSRTPKGRDTLLYQLGIIYSNAYDSYDYSSRNFKWLIPYVINAFESPHITPQYHNWIGLKKVIHSMHSVDRLHLPTLKYISLHYNRHLSRWAAAYLIANTVKTYEEAKEWLGDLCYSNDSLVCAIAALRCAELGDKEALNVFFFVSSFRDDWFRKNYFEDEFFTVGEWGRYKGRFAKLLSSIPDVPEFLDHRWWKNIRDYIYWDGQKYRVAEESQRQNMPVHPFTGEPLSKDEAAKTRFRYEEQERRLMNLKEAWQQNIAKSEMEWNR